MLLKVYSVFDVKAQAFAVPFFQATVGLALRGFQQACSDPATMLNKNPEDFLLYEIGTFDDSVGQITSHEKPISLACASDYVKSAE